MAEDLTKVNSYQDKFLEAMQIVSSQLISSIPYDRTITCTIIDDAEKDKGKYKVSTGDASFEAYSSDTKLRKDDVVYVTVPEGNYENQKIIQGKKTSDTEKPFVFTTPFDTMLRIVNVFEDQPEKSNGALIANNQYFKDDKTKLVYNSVVLYEKTGMAETGYTRLGIKGSFMSWLSEARQGSYGLRVTIKDKLKTTTTDTGEVEIKNQTKTILLDVFDMYGNPYSFEDYYSQEKVVPITDLNTITEIKVEFFQIAGSFYDVNNEFIEIQDIKELNENDQYVTSDFGHNLFVKDVEISLGYDTSEIADELIVPIINDSMTYSHFRKDDQNKKEIDLRWVHQFEDGPKVVKSEDFTPKEDSTQELKLKDCEIRWYRYRLGAAAADEYSGVYWTGQTVTKKGDKYILSDWDGKTKEVFVTDSDGNQIYEEDGKTEKKKIVPDFGYQYAMENIEFNPDITYQTEQLKAIIYLNGVAIRGPVITFRNEQDKTGDTVTDFVNALGIKCLDETNGNYLVYNEAGNILSQGDTNLERKLTCDFAQKGSEARSTLVLDSEKGDSISWKIPYSNSMISLQNIKENIETRTQKYYIYKWIKKDDGTLEKKEVGEGFEISNDDPTAPVYKTNDYYVIQGDAAFKDDIIYYPSYKINGYYSQYDMNNTIACTVQKDRIIYNAEKEFTFGVSGTMGSDYSIVIDFVEGHNAILVGDTLTNYALEVKMYDANNKQVDISNIEGGIKWSWHNATENLSGMVQMDVDSDGISSMNNILQLQVNEGSYELDKSLYIVKVEVGENNLTTYFPLSFKTREEYSHIEGTTEVIYLSDGYPEYYKGEYQLYTIQTNKDGIESTQLKKNNITWEIIHSSNEKEQQQYDGDLEEVTNTETGETKWSLKPISVYVDGAPNYGIACKDNGEVVWFQPILAIRNNYPSRVINKWDGKTLKLNEAEGYILSTAIAAGRKDENNTFTGVMIGDWSSTSTDSSLKSTGVYGFHQGAAAYAFKDDGTGFIGKDAIGRIEFNGNTAQICSSNYKTRTDDSAGSGMRIDFNGDNNNPSIEMYSGTSEMVLSTAEKGSGICMKSPKGSITITDDSSKNPLTISGTTVEGSDSYQNLFSVNWEGKVEADSGRIGCWDLKPTRTRTETIDGKTIVERYGGQLVATGTTGQAYWHQLELDPTRNIITGGKIKACIFEPTDSLTIKLGGTISVYDPSKKIEVRNPNTNENVKEINYDITKTATNTDPGILGGTLGFMKAHLGGDTDSNDHPYPKDFYPAGIGLKAEGGAELKVTNQNVGMNIGSNYLFLSSYETQDTTTNPPKTFTTSEFQVSVYGQTPPEPIIEYDSTTGESTITGYEGSGSYADSKLTFNGNGLQMTSGGDYGGRLILDMTNENPHAGIGFGLDSFLALYYTKAQLVGAYELECGINNCLPLIRGNPIRLTLGYVKELLDINEQNLSNLDIKGLNIAFYTGTLLDTNGKVLADVILNSSGLQVDRPANFNQTVNFNYGMILGNGSNQTVFQTSDKQLYIVDRPDTGSVTLSVSGTANFSGPTAICDESDDNIAFITATNSGANLLVGYGKTVNFTDATQIGIKAQFA